MLVSTLLRSTTPYAEKLLINNHANVGISHRLACDLFQSLGGSLVMVAKGNRTQQVTDACKKYGGFYLGSIGGPAAILAKNSIKSVEVVDFPELGMEAVRKIYVEDFPAFIIVDDKGNDFFADFKH